MLIVNNLHYLFNKTINRILVKLDTNSFDITANYNIFVCCSLTIEISYPLTVTRVACLAPIYQWDDSTPKNHLTDGKFVPVTLSERTSCVTAFQEPPLNRVSNKEKLVKLRALMVSKNISAYIIPNSDDHQVMRAFTNLRCYAYSLVCIIWNYVK